MTPLEQAARALCAFERRWQGLDEDGRRTYFDRARAVMAAIREPTEGEDFVVAIQRRIMIDAILDAPKSSDLTPV